MIPQLDELIAGLEREFGQRLNPRAKLAAKDYLEVWEQILNGVRNEEIKILVDFIMLNHNFPEIRNKRKAKKFWEELIANVAKSPADSGMIRLCAHYIAGTIGLESKQYRKAVHWPQKASNVVTGGDELYPEG